MSDKPPAIELSPATSSGAPASPSLVDTSASSPLPPVVIRAHAPAPPTAATNALALRPPSQNKQPEPSGGAPPTPDVLVGKQWPQSPAPSPSPPPSEKKELTPDQKELIKAILHAKIDDLYTKFNQTDWNFEAPVVGRTSPQSPLGLLLRPELNYGNLSRMSREEQYKLVAHVLSLPKEFTPRLDSHDRKPGFPFMRQTMAMHVVQAVYQGRTDLLDLLYETAADRARQGTGIAFDLRERFFASQITLLHMAAHDGRVEMAKWIVAKWQESAESNPDDPRAKEFTPDVEDGAKQTPLFWTFARGTVSVDLARYFVEECKCDFFRVFPLFDAKLECMREMPEYEKLNDKTQKVEKIAAKKMPHKCLVGYASPFSLAIQLAPSFVEERLKTKVENCGTRFQYQVMKNDFSGITLRAEQISKIQEQVDNLNEEESRKEDEARRDAQKNNTAVVEVKKKLEGQAFLAKAIEMIRGYVEQQVTDSRSKAKEGKMPANLWSEKDAKPYEPKPGEPKELSPCTCYFPPPDEIEAHQNRFDVSELRFVSQEPQGTRPNKDTWDTFYFDRVPLSSVELMVKHDRKRLLLQPIMQEIQERLWKHLHTRYYAMLGCYVLFGLLFAINTGLWPRTSQLIGSNMLYSFTPDSDELTWRTLYFICNLGCILLGIALLAFHVKAILNGADGWWANIKSAFRTSSSKLDLVILLVFIIVQCIQWSFLCHVQQFHSMDICSSSGTGGIGLNIGLTELDVDSLGALAWFSSFLHILLGMKILELISVFEFAGPLLSTLLGMFRDVGKFIVLFGIGYCAFACAIWIVLKDVFPENIPSGLNGPASKVIGNVEPQPSYTYADSLIHVVLWIFLSFDFEIFERTTLIGAASLGRILFLAFLLIMVLIMLNLMIAMFSNTYSDVVKDGKGEWHIRRSSVLCQLLRMTGDSRLARNHILEMGVDNNCGIDRLSPEDVNVEAIATGSRDGEEPNWAASVETNFSQLRVALTKMSREMTDLRTSVKKVHESKEKLAQPAAAAMGMLDPSPLPSP